MTQAMPLSLKTIAGVFSKANENDGFWELRGYSGLLTERPYWHSRKQEEELTLTR